VSRPGNGAGGALFLLAVGPAAALISLLLREPCLPACLQAG